MREYYSYVITLMLLFSYSINFMTVSINFMTVVKVYFVN